MAITRWSPFRELEALQDRINRLFGEPWIGSLTKTELAWAPAVNILEEENAVVVKAELPDMNEKDIEVKIDNNVLTIKGEKKMEKEEKKENYHLIESSYGSFSRSFSLPGNLDTDKATAKYEKGVLRITLPKKEEAKPKQIKIKVE